MAITNSALIRDALQLIEVLGIYETLLPEMSSNALPVLNRMLAQWKQQGIDLNYSNQSEADLGQECPIPDYAEQAVIYYLAFALAPKYHKVPSQDMVDLANGYFAALRRDAQAEALREARMDHMARGSGNTGNFDINTGQVVR